MWEDFIINAGIGAILVAIKNPNSERAIRLKTGLLHLADAIYAAFGGKPGEFPDRGAQGS